jgi:hypothetical protein
MPLIVVVVRQLRRRASEIMPEPVVVRLAAVLFRLVLILGVTVIASGAVVAVRVFAEDLRQIFS